MAASKTHPPFHKLELRPCAQLGETEADIPAIALARAVLVALFDEPSLTMPEVAQAMGITRELAWKDERRALLKLGRIFQEQRDTYGR